MSRRVGPQAILPPEGQTIKEMAAVLERCHLLVCNDSGPMHVAVALRIPVVAVFGPGHPSRSGPYTDGRNFRVLYEGYPCSPCRQKFFEECIPAPSGKPYCMEDVSEETVERACGELLAWAGADGVSSGAFFSERTSS
jgi:ADP-heptose:LPS heptosyltransferase